MTDSATRPLLDGWLATPDRYHFAFEGEDAVFLAMDRAAYRRSIFLDGRISPLNATIQRRSVSELSTISSSPRSQTRWIFHVAHCGSTLLARAIDQADGNVVLREPLPLRQLGADRTRTAGAYAAEAWRERLAIAATLVGRRYHPHAPVIVKANVPVNFILPELMAIDPDAPAILLYFPLTSYLQAILRGPNHRKWVTNVTAELDFAIAHEIGDMAGLDEVERAAALWLAQMRIYEGALAKHPNVVSLCADDLFNLPHQVIAATAAHFGLSMQSDEIDAIVASDLFSTYSKNPAVAFDNAARLDRQAALARALAPDIARARAWIARRLLAYPLPARLDRPLIGAAPLLLAS